MKFEWRMRFQCSASEPKVHRQRRQVVDDARDRRPIAALPLRGELAGLAGAHRDRSAAGLDVADVQDRPEVGLHLVLVMSGHLRSVASESAVQRVGVDSAYDLLALLSVPFNPSFRADPFGRLAAA
jgi:hypothetical protein